MDRVNDDELLKLANALTPLRMSGPTKERIKEALSKQGFSGQQMEAVIVQPTCEDALRLIPEIRRGERK